MRSNVAVSLPNFARRNNSSTCITAWLTAVSGTVCADTLTAKKKTPTARGTFVDRKLTLRDLENLAYAYAYGPDDRSQFLRDLAAATQGDYVPMARAAYDSAVATECRRSGLGLGLLGEPNLKN